MNCGREIFEIDTDNVAVYRYAILEGLIDIVGKEKITVAENIFPI